MPGLIPVPARRLPRALALLVLAAAAGAGGAVLAAAPAQAAACTGETGVTVVVDFTALDGGVATTCVADGGGDSAGDLFEVDHDLTRVQNFPGAVCKVDGAPGSAGCTRMPPSDAYWGLFWSDGSGGWVYSSDGVDALDIPDGGSVAFAWQDGGDQDYPAQPPTSQAEPSPSPSPSSGGSGGGTGSGGSGGSGGATSGGPGDGSGAGSTATGGGTGAGTGKATPSPAPGRPGADRAGRDGSGADDGARRERDGATEEATEEASATPDDPTTAVPTEGPGAAEPTAAAADAGLPGWVTPSLAGGLFLVAGGVALARRRSTG